MPGSRGHNPAGADPAKVAEWRRTRLAAVRERRIRSAGFDDALPVDMLADPEATRRAIADLA